METQNRVTVSIQIDLPFQSIRSESSLFVVKPFAFRITSRGKAILPSVHILSLSVLSKKFLDSVYMNLEIT